MTARPVFIAHSSSLAHDTGAHPEQPARMIAIERELSVRGWLGFDRLESPAVERSVLTAVHPEPYVASIEAAATAGGAQLDLDTVVSEGSFLAALHSAGGAVALVDLLLAGAAPTGFSAHRPPGHHALATRAMGFCLFNNVAVAAKHALANGAQRVLVLDWDVHHGNGTNDIFHDNPAVLYVSIHQWPLYPGTGPASDAGSGDAVGYTVNLPVPPGSGDAVYRSLVDHVVAPLARAFEPELLLVSAGFDAHRDDPLAGCTVTEQGFAAMAASVRRLGEGVGAPVGVVLEGGYALGPLARSVAATLEALGGSVARDAAEPVEIAPAAAEARARLAPWWPQLGAQI
jgi:acetoin utilization deacetylase AcuC-like enzyme